MFLRHNTRKKDGKVHRYWSVVENRRLRAGHTTQRTALYLGEINDTQPAAWRKSLDVLNEATQLTEQICLFPEDREIPPEVLNGLQVKLSELTLQHPRVFGDCWLACRLWDELHLGPFWRERLPDGKAEVPWFKVLELLTVRQRVAPGSKWHLHRRWFLTSAMDQLLDEDFAVAAKNRLYECLDRIDAHRAALFTHLQARWKDLFGAPYDLLLYDLTSTYFVGEMAQAPKAKHGYSRDQRGDCRQVVIAVVLSPEGFPLALWSKPRPLWAKVDSYYSTGLAYEIMPGNTSDKTTLKHFLEKIQTQYGQAKRIWIMDRGIPTEETLQEMRQSDPPVSYVVGTPRALGPWNNSPPISDDSPAAIPQAKLGSIQRRIGKSALAKTARHRRSQTAGPRRRSLCAGQKPRPARQRNSHPPAQTRQAPAPPARCVAPGNARGNATRSCTSWVARIKKPAQRGAS